MEENRTEATRVGLDFVPPSFRLNRAIRRIRFPHRWWHPPAVQQQSSRVLFRALLPILLFYGVGLAFQPGSILELSFPVTPHSYQLADGVADFEETNAFLESESSATQAVLCTGIQLRIPAEDGSQTMPDAVESDDAEPGVDTRHSENNTAQIESSPKVNDKEKPAGTGRPPQVLPDFIIKTAIPGLGHDSHQAPPSIKVAQAPAVPLPVEHSRMDCDNDSSLQLTIRKTITDYERSAPIPLECLVREKTYSETSRSLAVAGEPGISQAVQCTGMGAVGSGSVGIAVEETVTDYAYPRKETGTLSEPVVPQKGPFVSVIVIAERPPSADETAAMKRDLVRNLGGLKPEQIQVLIRHSDPLMGVAGKAAF